MTRSTAPEMINNESGLCWFVLVCVGLCWFVLVCVVGLCWFVLVCVGLCWTNPLVRETFQPRVPVRSHLGPGSDTWASWERVSTWDGTAVLSRHL
jgi:hypothetical protein